MNRRFTHVAVGLVAVFAAAQLVRPSSANPPTDPARTIGAHTGTEVTAIVERSCRDCHSNATVWPRYAKVAPLSWLMSSAVTKGRAAVNFSEWSTYPPNVRRMLLETSCEDAKSGKMPGVYAFLQPETKLSAHDVETICLAARQ
jgi:hypothetical protein